MITTQSKDALIALGARLRAAYLVQQAGYTLGLAAGEGQALEDLLEPNYIAEVEATKAKVEAALQDKELMASESKQLKQGQDEALREAKLWRRKVVKRGQRMRRLGRSIPDELTVITRASTVPDVYAQLTVMLASLRANLAAMGGAAAEQLAQAGEKLNENLAGADAKQEHARLAALPQKVKDFFAAKGELMVGLKVLNDAGQELHVADTVRAATYNLRILYRRAGARDPVPAPKPAPAAAAV